MGTELRSWWQKNKLLLITLTAVVLVVIVVFSSAVYWFGWDWTGFNGGYSQITTTSTSHGITTTTVKPLGKTFWDWLQILFVPIVLAIGGFWLNQVQKSREEKITEQRAENEKKAANERAKIDREIASDNQREAALQRYIDSMSELLLHEKLRKSADVFGSVIHAHLAFTKEARPEKRLKNGSEKRRPPLLDPSSRKIYFNGLFGPRKQCTTLKVPRGGLKL